MPAALKPYRDDELRNLRGDDQQGPYQEHDRVYRYDTYNDLGEGRPVLGGTADHPYPRRGRTGRKPNPNDPNLESRLSLLEQIYVPRDEKFGHLKMSDFLGYSIKAITQGIIPAVRTYVDTTPGEFDSFQDIINLYEGGIKLPKIAALEAMRKQFPLQLLKDLIPAGGDYLLKLPLPHIIKGTFSIEQCVCINLSRSLANIDAIYRGQAGVEDRRGVREGGARRRQPGDDCASHGE
jgi:linoleate 9S-lipoxygenase